jgi:pimeloyl-ACP methyl ester carboxylesterase
MPVPRERLALGDIEVAYSAVGAGPPLVLVHGLAEDGRTWADQQAALPHRRSYAPDLRGHGATTSGHGNGTLAQLGGDLVAFLETVSGPATVVGFSLGGTVALWAAAARPELVGHAIVLGTSSVVGRAAAAFYAERIELVRAGDPAAVREAIHADTAAALANPSVDVEAVVDQRLEAIGGGAGYVNAAAAMAALHHDPLTPRLAAIQGHVDVIGAEHDAFCPRKAADILLAALPRSSYREIPAAGHLMTVDAPEAVAGALVRSLEEEALR